MAWIYLAESEDSPLPLTNGLDQSHIAKSIPIVKQYCSIEWPDGTYQPLQYGMTYGLLERGLGIFLVPSLILFTEAFHARTSALQDAGKAWKESEVDYFSRSCAWPRKSSPSSYSLKTFQQSQQEGDFGSLEKLPKWGMIVDGVLYPLLPLERYISVKGGSYLPTPTALQIQEDYETYRIRMKSKIDPKSKGKTKPQNLQMAINIMFPTPRARDHNAEGMKSGMNRMSPSLPTIIKSMFPTPQACDATKGPAKEYIPNGKQSSMRNLVTLAARFSTTGKLLNPQFVEWLMEYPIGWTELEPWAMQWFQAKRKKLSKS